jgi:hypothetical protein
MKATTFQKVVPFACALIPAKLRFAKIQMAEAPPCVPPEVDEDMSMEFATTAGMIRPIPKVHVRQIRPLRVARGIETKQLSISFGFYLEKVRLKQLGIEKRSQLLLRPGAFGGRAGSAVS